MENNNRHYWLHKENYEGDVAMPLLEKGYLCYGWLFVAQKLNDYDSWKAIERIIREEFGYCPRNRFCLDRFLNQMERGDWVVVPRPGGEFSMYEITDDRAYPFKDIPDCEFQAYMNRLERKEDGFWKRTGSKEDLDLGFFRKVRKILDWSSKKDYVGAGLTSRMKYQMANIGLDDLREDVENAYSNAKARKKINVRDGILKEVPNLLNSLKDAIEPGKFERLVGWYFKKVGATQVDIPSKNMRGKSDYEDIDVTAYFSNLGTCYHVQVKFHDGISGERAVAQVSMAKKTGHYETNDDDTNIYWALTSADHFSQKAHEIAKAENIRLVTGPEFMKLLLDVGISDLDSAL